LDCGGVDSTGEEVGVFRRNGIRLLGTYFLRGALEGAVGEFVEDYNTERPHQGLENKMIEQRFEISRDGEIECESRLGGMLNYYHRIGA
jgi:hypothetical protein